MVRRTCAMRGVGGSRCVAPLILNLATTWRRGVRLTLWAIYPPPWEESFLSNVFESTLCVLNKHLRLYRKWLVKKLNWSLLMLKHCRYEGSDLGQRPRCWPAFRLNCSSEKNVPSLTMNLRILYRRHRDISLLFRGEVRGELSYLAPLGSEKISAPYFKQCFFRGGGGITPQAESKEIVIWPCWCFHGRYYFYSLKFTLIL